MAHEHGMIEPFEAGQVTRGGRQARSSPTAPRATATTSAARPNSRSSPTSTPPSSTRRHFDEKSFVDFKGDVCIIPPNSFALARTVEYFRIPRNVLTICLGKSTYARCGIIVNVTPLEPEWEGYVTLEFSNTTPLPAQDLRQRGRGAGDLLRVRRGLRDVVPRPRRQVPGPARRDAAAHLAPLPKFAKKMLDTRGHVPILRSSFFPFGFIEEKEVIMRGTRREAMVRNAGIRSLRPGHSRNLGSRERGEH